MARILYLMRHGETLFNQLGLKQGACDSPLTEAGISQAETAGRYLRAQNLVFEAAYSSTQERACDTIELAYGLDYTRLKGIKEWNFGRHEASPEYLHPDRNERGYWPFGEETGSFNGYYAHFGGESQEQVVERALSTLSQIAEEASDGANILAVSHLALMWAFFLHHYRGEVFPPVPFPKSSNCAIHRYRYENGQFTFLDSVSPLEWEAEQKGES